MRIIAMTMLAVSLLISACTPYMYGVPQETWDRMSEAERIEAIRVYESEQRARRQAAEERARRQALERERERARQAALERERRERIEAIHRGQGAYGELIRVRLQGGRIKIGGRHHHYEPLTFTIADGETRNIAVADERGREVDLAVTYAGGSLVVEGLRFPYERSWGRGRLYPGTSTAGALELRGVDVYVEVHDHSTRFERERPRIVVIREEPPPAHHPPQVRTPEHPKPPPAPPAAVRPPGSVEVVILSGEMRVRGGILKLDRASLRIAEGERRELTMKAGREQCSISLHYRGGELFIDGTPGRRGDEVRIAFEKEWQRGKVYRLGIGGNSPLENVELKVTGIVK